MSTVSALFVDGDAVAGEGNRMLIDTSVSSASHGLTVVKVKAHCWWDKSYPATESQRLDFISR